MSTLCLSRPRTALRSPAGLARLHPRALLQPVPPVADRLVGTRGQPRRDGTPARSELTHGADVFVVREAALPPNAEELQPPALPPARVWGKPLHLVDVSALRRGLQARYFGALFPSLDHKRRKSVVQWAFNALAAGFNWWLYVQAEIAAEMRSRRKSVAHMMNKTLSAAMLTWHCD